MRVLFVGGGTLGSVTPLLAVAEELQRELQIANCKLQISFWGTRRGPERALVEAAGIPFRSIPAGKLRRYRDIRNVVDAFIIVWAFVVSCARFSRQRPSVVVGAGSFVQVPVMWAAWLLRIPVVIHQQDARPGLANRLVAPLAAAITAVFSDSARAFSGRRVTVIGNPIRRSILTARDVNADGARRHFGFDPTLPTLLIIGGGTGAGEINNLVRRTLIDLTARTNVIHLTGRHKDDKKISADRYRQFELLSDELLYAYAAADLVISRAGMGTITELAALGKPVVLIPMPATHQEDNAQALALRGAVEFWDQRALDPAEFARRILALLDDGQRRATLAAAITAAFLGDAAGRLAGMVRGVASARS